MTTIPAQHAADLFGLYHDHEIIPEAQQRTAHGWTVLGSDASGWDRRGYDMYWMILRDQAGDVYGVQYGRSNGEHPDDLPWEKSTDPIEMTHLYPHVVTTYRTRPATSLGTTR